MQLVFQMLLLRSLTVPRVKRACVLINGEFGSKEITQGLAHTIGELKPVIDFYLFIFRKEVLNIIYD